MPTYFLGYVEHQRVWIWQLSTYTEEETTAFPPMPIWYGTVPVGRSNSASSWTWSNMDSSQNKTDSFLQTITSKSTSISQYLISSWRNLNLFTCMYPALGTVPFPDVWQWFKITCQCFLVRSRIVTNWILCCYISTFIQY